MISFHLFFVLVILFSNSNVKASDEDASKNRIFCGYLPPLVTNKIPFFPKNNSRTFDCSLCTSYDHCIWCSEGILKDVIVDGTKQADIQVQGFCWEGNLFGAKNRTYKDPNNKGSFIVDCTVTPFWQHCSIPGGVGVGVLVTFGLWICCIFVALWIIFWVRRNDNPTYYNRL